MACSSGYHQLLRLSGRLFCIEHAKVKEMSIERGENREIFIIQAVMVKNSTRVEGESLGKTAEVMQLSNSGIRFSNTEGIGGVGSPGGVAKLF
jgi:hypothetical protein